ncbi:hypothetical protein BGP_5391 [Beggiatoa sp. PS]|nr:hypothetical protein BGP_5391 [Beggiatoa sp. PS]
MMMQGPFFFGWAPFLLSTTDYLILIIRQIFKASNSKIILIKNYHFKRSSPKTNQTTFKWMNKAHKKLAKFY